MFRIDFTVAADKVLHLLFYCNVSYYVVLLINRKFCSTERIFRSDNIVLRVLSSAVCVGYMYNLSGKKRQKEPTVFYSIGLISWTNIARQINNDDNNQFAFIAFHN